MQTAHLVVKAHNQTGPVGVASAYPSLSQTCKPGKAALMPTARRISKAPKSPASKASDRGARDKASAPSPW